MSWWKSNIEHGERARSYIWARRAFILLILISLFSDFIANDDPILYKKDGSWVCPALTETLEFFIGGRRFSKMAYTDNSVFDFAILAPIPYSSKSLDLNNSNFVGPLSEQNVKSVRYRHWLGTDNLGRDVLAGMIHGCRIAMTIGLLSMALAVFFGVPFGLAMGFLGDDRWTIQPLKLVMTIIGGLLMLFYLGVMVQQYALEMVSGLGAMMRFFLICGGISLVIWLLNTLANQLFQTKKRVQIPLDSMGMRLIEVFRSIPGLFLLLALLSLGVKNSIFFIAFIIAILRWPTLSRYTRGEVLKVREEGYITSAITLGLPRWRIVKDYLLPNALGPVIVSVSFGISTAILVESGLSFLGLGLGVESVSWGSLLSAARSNYQAWWLALFPGLAIFCTVLIFNILGSYYAKILNPVLEHSVGE